MPDYFQPFTSHIKLRTLPLAVYYRGSLFKCVKFLFMKKPMKLIPLIISIFLIVQFQSAAQTVQIKGRIVDSESLEPLAFVSVQVNDGNEGCISDIDGKFTVRSVAAVKKLNISYIGYQPLEYIAESNKKEVLIRMQKTAYELSEVVIKPGINPANRIIREVIANRYINDHEHLPSFSYTSYEKMVFGPETDSIPHIDSLAADSSYIKAKEFFGKQHLFIMESVVKRSFKFPSENYNKVVATRVSGLSDPTFIFLISQLQSTTFYKEVIKIGDKDYINPISNGCFSKYYFELQDTLVEAYPYDTTFVISYRPLFRTKFDGLKGSISISTNGYAIRNVIAVPSADDGKMSIKIQQLYDFIDSTHWFPVQLNTDLIFKNGLISFDSTQKSGVKVMGRGKSYISDVNLDPKLRRNQFGAIEVDVQPDAYTQPEKIWNNYRVDSLTLRDQMTYKVIDSLGKAQHFDRWTRRLTSLRNGFIPFGYVDLNLNYLFRLNYHEGLRTGLKVSTTDIFSSWFRIGGYAAYGFKDKAWKYGADGTLFFDRFSDFKLKAGFYDDVDEAGSSTPFDQVRKLVNPERFREMLVARMDHTRCYEGMISSRLLKYMTLGAGISVYNRVPLYDYQYRLSSSENITITSSDFSFTETNLSVRYAYGEKFLRNSHSAISLGTSFPVIQFSAAHGFNGLLRGQYEYNRYDLKISKSMFIKYIGTTSITLRAGFIDRDIPYVNLYNARASYMSFSLYSPGSFSTMRMNEFTSDRYATLFISHNFGKLLFRSKYLNPQPELITNLGIGSLSHPENHLKDGIRGFEKGYFESGVAINRILQLSAAHIGFAWFYRYGPYALPSNNENMAWKIALQFVL